MGFGRGPCPAGTLPVFSVDSEEEARSLLVLACPTNYRGEFVAAELAEEQTLDNLRKFGERLASLYELMKRNRQQR